MSANNIPFRKKAALELFRIYRHNSAKIHTLKYLLWECTLRCNLNCRHCGSDCRKEAAVKDMPKEDFFRVLDDIKPFVNPHKTMIVLTGGEPLMRRDLEKIGEGIYQRGFPWGMVTNGMMLNVKRAQNLLNAGLRAVTMSLDGLEESHNRLRRQNKSFSRCMQTLDLLAPVKGLVYDVVTCVTPRNYDELPAIKTLLTEKGVQSWRLFSIFPTGRAADNNELQLSPIQFKGLFDFVKAARKQAGIQVSYGCEGFLGAYEKEVRDQFFFCQAGINIASVLADGSISACPNLRDNFIQGNIYNDHFAEVWENRYEPFRNRTQMKTGICADCEFFRYCEGNGMHLRDEDGQLKFCHLQRILQGEKE